MSIIAAQWTGNGVADGVDVTTANVNTSGNSTGTGVTWARSATGTFSFKYAGDGFEADSTSGSIARIDATLAASSTSVRSQCIVTVNQTPSAQVSLMLARNSSSTVNEIILSTARQVTVTYVGGYVSGGTTPAVNVGDRLLIDHVTALHSSPTTSNGRVFIRIKNLTNNTWNTTGEFFVDSGYAVNVGTANLAAVRFGNQNGAVATPGLRFAYLGAEGITVNTVDTSQLAAKAYFADAPPEPAVVLGTPAVTVTGSTNPTSLATSDGTVTVTWPNISNAHHYVAEIAPGHDAVNGFGITSNAATSPYTFTGLSGGDYTVAITAYPQD